MRTGIWSTNDKTQQCLKPRMSQNGLTDSLKHKTSVQIKKNQESQKKKEHCNMKAKYGYQKNCNERQSGDVTTYQLMDTKESRKRSGDYDSITDSNNQGRKS